MPGSDTTELRIFCTCGQKMKVSADMFGQPGKCIACRQKIRIPTPGQLPPNTGDVYLRDHPEFLRKVRRRRTTSRRSTPDPRRTEVQKDQQPPKRTTPLDVLEPLQVLCSKGALLEAEVAKLGDAPGGTQENTRDDLRKRRRHVRKALDELREELRQRLMEVAIELTATQEKIAESNLSVRVGELDFAQYQADIDRMRRRRDSLERRQQNLRGWMAVEDPYLAGGLRNVDLKEPPPREFRVTFRGDDEEKATSLEGLLNGLRDALALRSSSEERIETFARKRIQGEATQGRAADDELLAQANRERALAQLQYYRRRLDQRLQDYGGDLEAVAAQLDHARSAQSPKYNEVERELLRAKTDLVKGRDLIKRALAANSEHDVPASRGTFMERLTRFDEGDKPILEQGFAWAGAAALLAALFVHIADGVTAAGALQSFGSSGGAIWLIVIPVLAAAVTAAGALVPSAATRGGLLAGTALVVTTFGHWFFHETAYRDNGLAETIRRTGAWYLEPGVLVFCVALFLIAIAAAISLARAPMTRLWIPAVIAIALLANVVVGTDVFGVLQPKPEVMQARVTAPLVEGNLHTAEITVVNDGARAMHVRTNTSLRNGYRLLLERQVGVNFSWQDMGAPQSIGFGGTSIPVEDDRMPNVRIGSSQPATFSYALEPGSYRATLIPIHGEGTIESAFNIAPDAPKESSIAEEDLTDAPLDAPEQPAEEPAEDDEVELRPTSAQVKLRGVVEAPGRDPEFSIDVTSINGESESIWLGLGEELYGGWKVSEYNPEQQTVVLSNDISVLVLRRGEAQPLRTTTVPPR